MLKDKMWWLKEDEESEIRFEIRACREEGRQVEPHLARAEALLAMPAGEKRRKEADAVMTALESAPMNPEWPYIEPEDYEGIVAQSQGGGCLIGVPADERKARIRGAWTGRACGCLLGIPVEGWMRKRIHDYLEESGQLPLAGYIRSDVAEAVREKYGIRDQDASTPYGRRMVCWINNVDSFPPDDDTNYTVLSLRVLECCGIHFTPEDVAEAWVFGLPAFHTCTAERVAYRNLMLAKLPPESGRWHNPYREWIGAQIRVDFYGYIAAGNPRLAAEMAYRDAVVAQTKNGVYGAMYIAAVIAAAAVLKEPVEWVREGMKQIPAKSRLYEALAEQLSCFERGEDTKRLLERIHEKYNEADTYDWCLAISNTLVVTACILGYGHDYSAAILAAVQAGFDTDCNGATVGSIVGMACGIGGIESKWTKNLEQTLTSSVNGYQQITIEEAVQKTLCIMESVEREG